MMSGTGRIRGNRRHQMRMVKCLLLGSAAGLVAVAGAQAADLPVKAKPVGIREGLQSVWSWLLVRAGDGHVLEDWRVHSCPDDLEQRHQQHSDRRRQQ